MSDHDVRKNIASDHADRIALPVIYRRKGSEHEHLFVVDVGNIFQEANFIIAVKLRLIKALPHVIRIFRPAGSVDHTVFNTGLPVLICIGIEDIPHIFVVRLVGIIHQVDIGNLGVLLVGIHPLQRVFQLRAHLALFDAVPDILPVQAGFADGHDGGHVTIICLPHVSLVAEYSEGA